MKCPECNDEKSVIKSGIQRTKKGNIQRFYCKNCDNYFSDSKIPYTQYREKVIFYAIEQYNKGYPIKEVKKRTGKKYSSSPPIQTIYSWLKRYEDTLTFIRLRRNYDIHPDNVITTHTFNHQQVYPFKYHNLKLNFSAQDYPQLRRYISWVERSLNDKIFLKGPRASSTTIENNSSLEKKTNLSPELTRLALLTKQRNETTHETVERFFLINDSKTVCTELPVFLKENETGLIDLDFPLTGHIDMIQIRSKKVYIMDYKKNLRNPEQHESQLILYKEALHNRTSISKHNIILAVFNEHEYHEFT